MEKRLFSGESHLCKCSHALCQLSPSPLNILKALGHFFSSKSCICFDGMGSVFVVGWMSEHIKSCRLFYAKHLLHICLWLPWMGFTGVGGQCCTSSGCNQHRRDLVYPVTDEGLWESCRRISPQMRGFPRLYFSLDACVFQSLALTLSFYSLLKLISSLSSFLLSSEETFLSQTQCIRESRAPLIWLQFSEAAAAIVTKGACQLPYLLLAFWFIIHMERKVSNLIKILSFCLCFSRSFFFSFQLCRKAITVL